MLIGRMQKDGVVNSRDRDNRARRDGGTTQQYFRTDVSDDSSSDPMRDGQIDLARVDNATLARDCAAHFLITRHFDDPDEQSSSCLSVQKPAKPDFPDTGG